MSMTHSVKTHHHGILLAFVLACGQVSMGHAKGHLSSMRLSFRHVVDGKPLLSDSLRYQNAYGETYSISRLSYLLSGFALETETGELIALPDQTVWMDLGKRRTSATLTSIPEGRYRSLRFFIGPEAKDNERDPVSFPPEHPLNPNANGLHWSWQGGFIFMALEGKFSSEGSSISGFSHHLARSPNRTPITLAGNLDLAYPLTCEIDFDIGSLLNAPQPLSFLRDGKSTHSREGDPIAQALVKNLPGAFRMRQLVSNVPEVMLASKVKPLYLPVNFTPYPFKLSRSFPMPSLPRDNPLLQERVDLGRRLFHETSLSRDGTISCATCHLQKHAFTDPRRFSVGVDGQEGTRNAMPLFNLAWKTSFFWEGRAPSLRAQVLMPIQDHTEMDETLENVTDKLSKQEGYPAAFARAFDSPEVTSERIGLAIENFLLTQTSFQSKFDQVLGGKARFSAAEQRGFELFMTEYEPRSQRFGADCFHCHGGALFSDHQFHNNGLDDLSAIDSGRFNVTGEAGDQGKFATPSLRNVTLTAPYMHDGRFATLTQVVEHYNSELVRSPTLDANLAKHPASGLGLSKKEVRALVAFLETLTDEQYTNLSR